MIENSFDYAIEELPSLDMLSFMSVISSPSVGVIIFPTPYVHLSMIFLHYAIAFSPIVLVFSKIYVFYIIHELLLGIHSNPTPCLLPSSLLDRSHSPRYTFPLKFHSKQSFLSLNTTQFVYFLIERIWGVYSISLKMDDISWYNSYPLVSGDGGFFNPSGMSKAIFTFYSPSTNNCLMILIGELKLILIWLVDDLLMMNPLMKFFSFIFYLSYTPRGLLICCWKSLKLLFVSLFSDGGRF